MAGSVNKAILIGNLGRDPEIRNNQAGERIATLSIATSESWKDKNSGERKERTEWHRVVIFNDGLSGIAEKYLKKGAKVHVEGQLQTRKWTDQQGTERYTTEIVLSRFKGELTLLSSGDGGTYPPPAEEPEASAGRARRQPDPGSSSWDAPSGLDDEIPF